MTAERKFNLAKKACNNICSKMTKCIECPLDNHPICILDAYDITTSQVDDAIDVMRRFIESHEERT